MDFWYVGQVKRAPESDDTWEFQGVFDTEQKAEAACRSAFYFLCRVRLNEELPDETVIPDAERGFRWAGYEKLSPQEQQEAWPEVFGQSVGESAK